MGSGCRRGYIVYNRKNHLLVNDVGMAKHFSKKYGNKG